MRTRLMRPHSQRGIEQQYALLSPAGQIARSRNVGSYVILDFLEDIHQRRRKRNTVVHRKAKTMGLSRSVIRILPDNNYLHFIEGAKIESIENQLSRRIDRPMGIFLAHEFGQRAEVIFSNSGCKRAFQLSSI